MNAYFLHGKLSALPGQRTALADILLEAADLMREVSSCRLYAVGIDPDDIQSVYVTEVWESQQAHDDALKAEAVRTLITQAMPLLSGPPAKGQTLTLLGGKGI